MPEQRALWRDELAKVKRCQQRQDGMMDQLKDLRMIANKFGFYDAAGYLRDPAQKDSRD
jgi:hypothetical protein